MKGHGGDIYAASQALSISADKIIDFSASINPLGVPGSVRRTIIAHLGQLRHYPDPSANELRNEIARSIKVDPGSIICGNGSTELIYLVARAMQPRKVLIPAPTFSEYENAIITCRRVSKYAGTNHKSISYFTLNEQDNFRLNPNEFIDAMSGMDMVFLCNPNNPTGGLVRKRDMARITDAARQAGCCLVVDEAFTDFIPGESIVRKVKDNPYLIVLRSLTKFYALSGLRLGYAVVNPELYSTIMPFKEPWTVNTLAQLSGIVALKDSLYADRTFDAISDGKKYLEAELIKMGIKYYPSSINFYLLRLDNASDVLSELRGKGILVRDCSNFRGLDGSYIRIAVRTQNENRRLLRELAELWRAL